MGYFYETETCSLNGAPKESRTPNLQIRSLTLYPIELWVHRITVYSQFNELLQAIFCTCVGTRFIYYYFMVSGAPFANG
jgi:hypothetical protein